jgi:glutathione S-transferase
MPLVYHLVTRADWERCAGDYRAASLETEGFIHCSYAGQVAASANRFYADAGVLLLLHVEPERLSSPLKAEPAGSGELFPHVYGPIDRPAVVRVEALRRGADGRWAFPE